MIDLKAAQFKTLGDSIYLGGHKIDEIWKGNIKIYPENGGGVPFYVRGYATAVIGNYIHLLGGNKHYIGDASGVFHEAANELPFTIDITNVSERSHVCVHNNSIHYVSSNGTYYVWDGSNWVRGDDISLTSGGISGICSYGGDLYAFGVVPFLFGVTGIAFRYDGSWVRIGSRMGSHSFADFISYDGYVNAFGSPVTTAYNDHSIMTDSSSYGKAWTRKSTIPFKYITSGSCVIYDGKIHAFDINYNNQTIGSNHFAWNGSGWSNISGYQPFPNGLIPDFASIASIGGEIHLFGGGRLESEECHHYAYSTSGGWRQLEDLTIVS